MGQPDQLNEMPPKKPIWKRWWFWALIAVLLIGIASSGGSNGDNEATNTEDNGAQTVMSQQSEPENPQTFKQGMYKIGSDMPPGEYVLLAKGMGYFAITTDSTGSLDSIVANDNFSSRSIVAVSAGQYLELKGCEAVPIDKAPPVNTASGVLGPGMYKVGIDLPAGEYKVESSNAGYVEVSSNSSHTLDAIVTNDNFSGSKYITVQDGQYLKLVNAKLNLK